MRYAEIEHYIRTNFDEILETYEKYWSEALEYKKFEKIKGNAQKIQFIANYKKHPIEDILIIFKEERVDYNELQDS